MHKPSIILPVFPVILLLEFFFKRLQFVNNFLVQALNQSDHPVFLPVPIFREIAPSPFQKNFNGLLIPSAFPMGLSSALIRPIGLVGLIWLR